MGYSRSMDEALELHTLLRASATFGALDPTARMTLAAAMHPELVAPGHVLLRQGEVGDALFVVSRGQFEVRVQRDDGREAVIDTAGRGDVIGEMQLVVGGAASATVVAASESQVYRLQRGDFEALCAATPALLDTLARIAARRLQRRQMLAVLPAMFGSLDAATLTELERHLSWRTLRRGEVLFRKGERGDAWYVVTSGRLAVVEPAVNGRPERLLSEVGRGEGIGEMALLTGQPRSATVYALRDAELARFPVELVAEWVATRPQVTRAMLRSLALRVMQQSGTTERTEAAGLTLTLVPASPGVNIADLAQRLTVALGRFGAARQVSSVHLHEVGVGRDAADRPDTHPTWIRVSAWLDEQSNAHRFVVLVADPAPNAWSARAVGHADRVIIVGNADGEPRPGTLERALLPSATEQRDVRRLLVLLHRDGTQPPRGTARWLDARTVEAHLHLRMDRSDDIERLARRLAGRGVALTLSGGGARCCAHMGVVRAMREHGIPIDLVTGTSAGSLAGYLAALGASTEEMGRAALRLFRARPFKGYTLPLFSLLNGNRLSRALREQCGDTQLEDLWLPLVVVSANLTRRSVELHTRGPVWQALRASCSLPGLVEPLIRDGQLLVDGGLIDNLPVGVARERLAGRVIAVDVTADLDVSTTASAYPSPWFEFAARVVKQRGRLPGAPPGMFEVMLHSLLLASLAHTQRMRLEADLCLRPELAQFGLLALGRHAEIIEAGYRHAQEHLAAFAP
jgi:predicted acylesterase/phospholipase RssA/CRP-like cAMP-binding protein